MCVIVLFVCTLSFARVSYLESEPTYRGTNSGTQDENPWWSYAGFWESIGTWAIAVYAIRQYRESRRSSEKQLRAYCLVESIQIGDLTIGRNPKISVTIKNYGQMPALNYTQIGISGIDQYPLPIFPDTSASHSHSQKIGPGGTVEMNVSPADTLNAQNIKAIREESQGIYFVGRFSYDAGFGEIVTEEIKAITVGVMMLDTASMANYVLPEKSNPGGWKDAIERAKAKLNS